MATRKFLINEKFANNLKSKTIYKTLITFLKKERRTPDSNPQIGRVPYYRRNPSYSVQNLVFPVTYAKPLTILNNFLKEIMQKSELITTVVPIISPRMRSVTLDIILNKC